jgi:GntR family transcriptional regulator / MocR family aminotransferase
LNSHFEFRGVFMGYARAVVHLNFPLQLEVKAGFSLEEQLVRQLRQAITIRQIAPGTRLPSTRTLARELGVSRTVTSGAFDRLIAEGYLESQARSGTFVSRNLPLSLDIKVERPEISPRWLPRIALQCSSGFAPETAFCTGVTSTQNFPQQAWCSAWKRAAKYPPPNDYRSSSGELEFRAAIASYVGRSRGLVCQPENIVVTSGTTQSLDLLLRAILKPEDSVAMEDPSHPEIRRLILLHTAQMIPIPVDEDGIQVSALPANTQTSSRSPAIAPILVYVTPSHQYPLGTRLSISRRLALIEWAQANDSLIIEDDYDSEFRFDVPPLPALAALDSNRVAYLGTFSKTITPSLRCGYLVASRELCEAIANLKSLTEGTVSWTVQSALTTFITEGDLEQHVRRMRQHYGNIRTALETTFLPIQHLVKCRGIEAGLHACLELSPNLNSQAIVYEAQKRGITLTSLCTFYHGAPNLEGLVLGYAGLKMQEVVAQTQILVEIIQAEARYF